MNVYRVMKRFTWTSWRVTIPQWHACAWMLTMLILVSPIKMKRTSWRTGRVALMSRGWVQTAAISSLCRTSTPCLRKKTWARETDTGRHRHTSASGRAPLHLEQNYCQDDEAPGGESVLGEWGAESWRDLFSFKNVSQMILICASWRWGRFRARKDVLPCWRILDLSPQVIRWNWHSTWDYWDTVSISCFLGHSTEEAGLSYNDAPSQFVTLTASWNYLGVLKHTDVQASSRPTKQNLWE